MTTNLALSDNASPGQTLVSVRDRLAEIRDSASQLVVDAQWLAIGAGGLLEELKQIAEEPATAAMTIALNAARDAAAWTEHAAENIDDELSSLVAEVNAALE